LETVARFALRSRRHVSFAGTTVNRKSVGLSCTVASADELVQATRERFAS
jgi:hypothetical protein